MISDAIALARGGDEVAFRELTQPYRRELHTYCYRMVGSFQDAEDIVQETLVAAWRSISGFEERSSLRTWLYRIATNRCLNARRDATRRPVKEWDVPNVNPPTPTRLGEVVWLEPYPDALLTEPLGSVSNPEVRIELRESISLAFITALQLLPSRQLAVLVLRDVLGFTAREVADMLDASTESVNSALKRARFSLRKRWPLHADANHRLSKRPSTTPSEDEVVAKFVVAWENADVDSLVTMLTDDVFMSMPPIPFEYEGKDVVARFSANIFEAGRRFDLVPTRANGQPAFGAYLRSADGTSHGVGLYVLTLRGTKIRALTRFENRVLATFGLPPSMPSFLNR